VPEGLSAYTTRGGNDHHHQALDELDRSLTMASEKEAALAAVPNENPTM
jgi:hypothetical protein